MKLDDPGDECYNELADKGYIVDEHEVQHLVETDIVEGNVHLCGQSVEGQSIAGWVYDGPRPSVEEIYERFSRE